MSLFPMWSDLDWNRVGKQVSTLNIEHSVNRSAYGIIPVPAAVINNGKGPTVLLVAGSHGDEYEGQIVLSRLIQSIVPEQIAGRLIVLPAANLPASLEGTRVSPLDGGNLNRSFSEIAGDTPTSVIARYISEVLLPISDVMFDFHSGGTSLNYLPCVYADIPEEEDEGKKVTAALDFINAPITWIHRGVSKGNVAGAAAARHGVMYISGEFGGAGRVSREGVASAERALYRLLAHTGILPLAADWAAVGPSRHMQAEQFHYVYATHDGVFDPACELGGEIGAGDLLGSLYNPETPLRALSPVTAPASGLWACTRALGRVRAGDCLGHLLSDVSPAGRAS